MGQVTGVNGKNKKEDAKKKDAKEEKDARRNKKNSQKKPLSLRHTQ